MQFMTLTSKCHILLENKRNLKMQLLLYILLFGTPVSAELPKSHIQKRFSGSSGHGEKIGTQFIRPWTIFSRLAIRAVAQYKRATAPLLCRSFIEGRLIKVIANTHRTQTLTWVLTSMWIIKCLVSFSLIPSVSHRILLHRWFNWSFWTHRTITPRI